MSFNGAAASQLRKFVSQRVLLSQSNPLQWGRSISAAEMVLTETSDLLHVLTHDASTLLSAPNRFHIEQVAAPPSQNSYLQIMQLQSRERFRRFSQHGTARTMRQTTPLHHMSLPLYWRECLP